MKSKGFTLPELLVVIVIMLVIGGIATCIYKGVTSGEDVNFTFINPVVETARSQRRMADEMTRQNDIMQRRLELLESQNKKAEYDQ